MEILTLLAATALAPAPARSAPLPRAEPVRIDVGPLVLEVHVSPTAHLFHVVDQLAAWSPFCHGQYARGMEPLSASEEEALALHRRVRAARGWGQGLEQAFYTDLPLEEALASGVEAGHLDPEQAVLEAEVFEALAPRVEALLAAERPRLVATREAIAAEAESLGQLAGRLARLVRVEALHVPVFLIANPADHDFGGGFNGGRLTLEVPRVADVHGTFRHEIFHAFLDVRRGALEAALVGAPERLDLQTLNEGLAHAIAPGLYHAEGESADPLAHRVREVRRRGQGLDTYEGRVYRYALALRPLVRDALGDEDVDLAVWLARAVDLWRAVEELALAEAPLEGE